MNQRDRLFSIIVDDEMPEGEIWFVQPARIITAPNGDRVVEPPVVVAKIVNFTLDSQLWRQEDAQPS